MSRTVADALVDALKRDGVTHVYGVPGGGGSLDMIRACGDRDVRFVLTRTEAAAVIMAAVSAELGGAIGVALTTRGPGTASAANGVAYASLDRAPVMLVSEGWSRDASGYDSHQVFDQPALMAPLVKAHSRLDGDDPVAEIDRLIRTAKAPAAGPVYVELAGSTAARTLAPGTPASADDPSPSPAAGDMEAVWERLAEARKPVLIVGLEARAPAVVERVRRLVQELGCPVITTYKGRGVVSDDSGCVVGNFTGGAVERACVGEADLIVLLGLDPVELIGQPWPYVAPVVELAARKHPIHYVTPDAAVHGPLEATLAALQGPFGGSKWTAEAIAGHRARMRQDLAHPSADGALTPDAVIDVAAELTGVARPRITVDAGAHMFSAMARWPCGEPNDALISNGLATMGFALPAALAARLADPARPVLAFTGDGGLMMCAGELSTLAQHGRGICVVVLNDAAYSMIRLKQQARQLPRAGLEWPRPDFATVATGFGLRGYRADSTESYRDALAEALASDQPALIDAVIDPSGYPAQARVMRG